MVFPSETDVLSMSRLVSGWLNEKQRSASKNRCGSEDPEAGRAAGAADPNNE